MRAWYAYLDVIIAVRVCTVHYCGGVVATYCTIRCLSCTSTKPDFLGCGPKRRLDMALRRNLQRKCRLTVIKAQTITSASPNITRSGRDGSCRKVGLDTTRIRHSTIGSLEDPRILITPPFPFFQLPREIRDHVYSYLIVSRGSGRELVIDAATVLKKRKKRVVVQSARDRLNRQRLASGKRPVCARTTISEPVVDLNLLQVSQRMYREASDFLYSSNWFAIPLSKLPSTAIETPAGWDLSRIKRLKLEL